MVHIGIGQLELLDTEYQALLDSGFFVKKGRQGSEYIYDDTAAMADKDVASLPLTRSQREIYIYWKVFKEAKTCTSDREIARRIALIIYGRKRGAHSNAYRIMEQIAEKEGVDMNV